MKKGIAFVKKAVKDFELAHKYRNAKEYITASMLYRRATEKALKALILQKNKSLPTKNATIEYLAMQAKLPESIYEEVTSMPDEMTEMMEEESLSEYDEEEHTFRARENEYKGALSKHETVRKLLDYARSSTSI